MNDEFRIRLIEAEMLIEMMDGDTVGIHNHGFSDDDLIWGAHSLIQSVVNSDEVPEKTINMLEKIHDFAYSWVQ